MLISVSFLGQVHTFTSKLVTENIFKHGSKNQLDRGYWWWPRKALFVSRYHNIKCVMIYKNMAQPESAYKIQHWFCIFHVKSKFYSEDSILC